MKPLRYCALAASACLLAGCGQDAHSADKVEVVASGPNLRLGVQTHFSQGWPHSAVGKAKEVRASLLRDSIPWRAVERRPGVYDFSSPRAKALQSACDSGLKLILTQVPQNPLYDPGYFVHSPPGKAAYAAFIDALLKKFGNCVIGIEVGNEINGRNFKYPPGADGMESYVSLLSVLRDTIKPAFPRVAILGGSTNQIGTGFLKKLFAKGMLEQVDGIAVHPYRSHAQGVDLELRNLNAAMKAAGRVVPVWATEFGHDLADKDRAAGEMIKMVTLMAGANVDVAAWYALLDQPHFPNFGLYADTAQKPQARAFATAQKLLVPHGRPRRLAFGPLANVWKFDNGTVVAWGAPGALKLSGATAIHDAKGNALPVGSSVAIGDSPVIIVGGKVLSLGGSPVVADSLLGYGTDQWSYIARAATGADATLSPQDDHWTSYFGSRYTKPLRIGLGSAAPGGNQAKPVRAVLRYVAPAASTLELSSCFAKKPAGDGVDYAITRNGQPVRQGVFNGKEYLTAVPIPVAAGDKLDFAFGPNGQSGHDTFAYRITLFHQGEAKKVECP